MKIFIKSAAILTVLLGSGLSQAANTTASIPMGVEVPKSCSFSDVSSGLVLPEDGSEVQGSFTFSCNMNGGFSATYFLDSSSSNTGSSVTNTDRVNLPIMGRIKVEGFNLSLDSNPQTVNYLNGWLNRSTTGVVSAQLVNPITATTPAGVYTDTFRVNVNY